MGLPVLSETEDSELLGTTSTPSFLEERRLSRIVIRNFRLLILTKATMNKIINKIYTR